MLDRIDPSLNRAEPRPLGGASGEQHGRGGARQGASTAAAGMAAEGEGGQEPVDDQLARLAATIADVERLVREVAEAGPDDESAFADAHLVAAQIARDGAAALAAQAAIGPAGVRLILETIDRPQPEAPPALD